MHDIDTFLKNLTNITIVQFSHPSGVREDDRFRDRS